LDALKAGLSSEKIKIYCRCVAKGFLDLTPDSEIPSLMESMAKNAPVVIVPNC
jgi:hypothetical protein